MLKNFLLEKASVYKAFQNLISSQETLINFVKDLHLKKGDKILDIGCGPADILAYMPDDIDYTGFDNNPEYIKSATKIYGTKGRFFCESADADLCAKGIIKEEYFDFVLVLNTIHHLSDTQTIKMFEIAKKSMITGGKLVTVDGCFTKNQSFIKKIILKMDRGKYVRKDRDYLRLARTQFDDVRSKVKHNLINIPYTHIIMECTKN